MEFLQVEEPHKYTPGPVLLLAGPGSGKTHCLALRIKWLVETQGADPNTITVITFTTEATRAMRDRLSDEERPDVYMPKERQPAIISTMHSLGHSIITRNLADVGLRDDFNVVSSEELRSALFGDAAQLLGYPRNLGQQAKLARTKGEALPNGSDKARICEAYSQILRACNAIDYDDQIRLACELLRTQAALRAEYQARTRHLLVDEYQDINADQFALIRLLSRNAPEGLFVVGDDDQSIYRFRGGSPEYIRNFARHFGAAARVLILPVCRRCPPKVLNGALEVAKRFNVGRLEKPDPSPLSSDQSPILVYDLPSDLEEAQRLADTCARLLPTRDILILVPTTRFAESIARSLRRKRIQYDWRPSIEAAGLSKVGRLFEFLNDPGNSLALRQCVNTLCDNGALGIPGPRSRTKEKVNLREEALGRISGLWKRVLMDGGTLLDSLRTRARRGAVLAKLGESVESLQKAHAGPVDAFLATVGRIIRPWGEPEDLGTELRSWAAEISGRGGLGEGVVRILTMRMAKGLEADHVFIVGLEEGVFPNARLSAEELAEASRLFYVSMTRAKMQLHISHARKRAAGATFLPRSYNLKPSPFLKAIPKDCCDFRYTPGRSRKNGRASRAP